MMDKVTVVLADDHAVVRSGIYNALKEMAYLEIVGEVGDGSAILPALSQLNPDLLLIDVTMPHFEPISIIQQIRTIYPDMKVLVVSAYDDDVYVQGLLGVGVHGYHLKDQPLSDLRLAVERILAGEKWVSGRLLDRLLDPSDGVVATPVMTGRQQEILRLLLQGLDNHTIALQTGLSVKTVENHLTRLYRQIGVQSRLEAVNYASQHPDVLRSSGQTAVSHTTRPPSRATFSLLLVDDNARYRGQLRRTVNKVYPQAMIHEAATIHEATEISKQVLPRLVLVDVVLGDEDGIQCTRRIKALSPASRIVLISAYPDREFHRLGLEAGAIAFLDKKDLDTATLQQVIEDVIE
jgi:DNA-binding NarL/FixJ family response regulator